MKEGRIIKIPVGLHILGAIFSYNRNFLKSLDSAKRFIKKIIKKYQLHELGSFYYQFPHGGFTGVVSLVESHIAIHTWPELGYLTLDVYLCNYSRDNSKIAKLIFQEIAIFFKPSKICKKFIKR